MKSANRFNCQQTLHFWGVEMHLRQINSLHRSFMKIGTNTEENYRIEVSGMLNCSPSKLISMA